MSRPDAEYEMKGIASGLRATLKRGVTFGRSGAYAQMDDEDAAAEREPVLKRKQTIMVPTKVELENGHFIVDTPISQRYLENVRYAKSDEFTHLRYTAATTEPNDFAATYSLRQKLGARKTKIAVVCTMYNEDDVLFAKTISAVQENIAYLCSGCPGWDADAWREIVVVIVSDGRGKVNQSTLDLLSAMGCYMDGLTRSSVNDEEVTGHVFEFTTQLKIDHELRLEWCNNQSNEAVFPMQTVFLLKEKNAKKINSHRWFFNAICSQLQPEVCLLLDIGTRPTHNSFYHLYRAFERNSNVAGACGEIAADLGTGWVNLLNPIVAVQNFEYKMSNILDKPLESVFGYISVLPGAFSAYRYRALLGRPLESYFKGENPHGTNVSEANMYLAEDRILCFELVMKKKCQYVLKYVKDARAETDVPAEFQDLIKQRRRWLNGSFFASLHSILNFHRIFTSGHGIFRKFILTFQTLYNCINLLFSWFGIGNMYLAFYFLFNIVQNESMAVCTGAIVSALGDDPFYPYGGAVSGVLRAVYMSSMLAILVASLGNRPEAAKYLYLVFAIFFAIIMAFMIFMGIWSIKVDIAAYLDAAEYGKMNLKSYLFTNGNFGGLVVSILSTYFLYAFSSILYMDPWHIITCLFQYMFMIPSFPNILMLYAFCNIHDISWGTKGIEAAPLPGVKVSVDEEGKTTTTVNLPARNRDADEVYSSVLLKIERESDQLDHRKADGSTERNMDDFFRQYRTTTVLLWLFSNFLLVFVLTNGWIASRMLNGGSIKDYINAKPMRRDNTPLSPGGYGTDALIKFLQRVSEPGNARGNAYLIGLLWAVAGLSAIRFTFSTIYLLGWLLDRGTDKQTWQNIKRARSKSSEKSVAA
ncbi:Chitin synthase, class 2 [Chytriomyces hyalinus]|nr:Chitin synthase, class 2 [Chytriomyces hyalinus]